ncbi:MAG TPA: hypothetical protein VHT31_04685, partial [Candidatus Acidoferrum sp.]|nr:hypothetical protein [Candidatus Acidoferrum sp.]
LVRPLPYPNHDRILQIQESHHSDAGANLTYATFLDMLLAVAALPVLIAVVACYIAARRAMRVIPSWLCATSEKTPVRSDSPFTKRSGDMVYNSWLD